MTMATMISGRLLKVSESRHASAMRSSMRSKMPPKSSMTDRRMQMPYCKWRLEVIVQQMPQFASDFIAQASVSKSSESLLA